MDGAGTVSRKRKYDCGSCELDRLQSCAGTACRFLRYYPSIVQTISLKLPDDLLAELEREAKARRVSKSVLIRDSLERALRERSHESAASCYELARDLAGSVKGLPRDLATNPKYMKGFGE